MWDASIEVRVTKGVGKQVSAVKGPSFQVSIILTEAERTRLDPKLPKAAALVTVAGNCHWEGTFGLDDRHVISIIAIQLRTVHSLTSSRLRTEECE